MRRARLLVRASLAAVVLLAVEAASVDAQSRRPQKAGAKAGKDAKGDEKEEAKEKDKEKAEGNGKDGEGRVVGAEKKSGSGPAVVEEKESGDAGVKTYKFGPVDVEGRLKSPQIVYFLRRVRAEFAAGQLGHRSFLGELRDTRRNAALK
jgi:hypothetical protein